MQTMSVTRTVNYIKEADQDFEWYPTTDEMLDAILEFHREEFCKHSDGSYSDFTRCKILDIGAGNGKVLHYFKEKGLASDLYAIEKSEILRMQLHQDVFVIGTDIKEQSLWDKNIDMIFCNPPYSEYSEWVTKILYEAMADGIYLIIPQRWRENKDIQIALRTRKSIEIKSVGFFNFLNGERGARATVEIVYIENNRKGWRQEEHDEDPFNMFFNDYFQELADKFDAKEVIPEDKPEEELTIRKNLIVSLVEGYRSEQDSIIKAYKELGNVSRKTLLEIGVNKKMLRDLLKKKIVDLKNDYWKKLFDHFDELTSKLTSKTREKMLDTLTSHTAVDFTESNCYSIVIWAMKQVNIYIDQQLIDVFEELVGNDTSYSNYKSNERVFKFDWWKYKNDEYPPGEKPSHFKLDYRIVAEHSGGISTCSYEYHRGMNTNLNQSGFNLVDDIRVVANNLGYKVVTNPMNLVFSAGSPELLVNKEGQTLVRVKAHKNQNIHLQFDQKLMLAINVEYGRLKGWLSTPHEAAHELEDERAIKMFDSTLKLGKTNVALLKAPEEEINENPFD